MKTTIGGNGRKKQAGQGVKYRNGRHRGMNQKGGSAVGVKEKKVNTENTETEGEQKEKEYIL